MPRHGKKLSEIEAEKIKRAMLAHLSERGDAGWKEFKFRDRISYQTLRRWVAELKPMVPSYEPAEIDEGRVTREDIETLVRVDAKRPPATSGLELPQAPINVLSRVNVMLRDCDLVRARAIKTDEDGKEYAANPKLLLAVISAETKAISALVDAQDKLYGIGRVQTLMYLMLQRLHELEPGVARKVLAGLRELDETYGVVAG